MNAVGNLAPMRGAIVHAHGSGDLSQAVARRPAHDARKCVHRGAGSQFPGAGIGLVVNPRSDLSHALKAREQTGQPRAIEALIEKRMRHGQDDAAVHVVLTLRVSRVADPHRLEASIPRQGWCNLFLQNGASGYSIKRLQILRAAVLDHILDERYVVFHRAGDAEPVQRVYYEIGIAQPAVTVIQLRWVSGASGIDVVRAATIAPVSS